ncbi:hypothetical protein Dsin_016112 [Dipteronia sinensis]|uniref:DNA helicase n=1 Tax=Dipteronia sinensis TaxID=43782 RepID=A0AAE0ACG7_9ROSI|nr:hypothetical protein Dsin_016112 [Dipteronia sinensis]
MVSLKGMVIRCSLIIPEIREAIFRCLVCGYFSEAIGVDRGRISEPTTCLKQECHAKNSMTLVHNRCRSPTRNHLVLFILNILSYIFKKLSIASI